MVTQNNKLNVKIGKKLQNMGVGPVAHLYIPKNVRFQLSPNGTVGNGSSALRRWVLRGKNLTRFP